jgi:hypothetical protein
MSWAQVAREVGGVSAGTIKGLGSRGTVEGDGVLQVLRWLGRSPESFLSGELGVTEADAELPPSSQGGVLRFDAREIFKALDAERTERDLTWRQVASEAGLANADRLTRLRRGGRVSFPDVMRVFAWLGKPAARFARVVGG